MKALKKQHEQECGNTTTSNGVQLEDCSNATMRNNIGGYLGEPTPTSILDQIDLQGMQEKASQIGDKVSDLWDAIPTTGSLLENQLALLEKPGDSITIDVGAMAKIEFGVEGSLNVMIERLEGGRYRTTYSAGLSLMFSPDLGIKAGTGAAQIGVELAGGISGGLALEYADMAHTVLAIETLVEHISRTAINNLTGSGFGSPLNQFDIGDGNPAAAMDDLVDPNGTTQLFVTGDAAFEIAGSLGLIIADAARIAGGNAALSGGRELGVGVEFTDGLTPSALNFSDMLTGEVQFGAGLGLSEIINEDGVNKTGDGIETGVSGSVSGAISVENQAKFHFESANHASTPDATNRVAQVLANWFPQLGITPTTPFPVPVRQADYTQSVTIELLGELTARTTMQKGERIILTSHMDPMEFTNKVVELISELPNADNPLECIRSVGFEADLEAQTFTRTGIDIAPELSLNGVGGGAEFAYIRENIQSSTHYDQEDLFEQLESLEEKLNPM